MDFFRVLIDNRGKWGSVSFHCGKDVQRQFSASCCFLKVGIIMNASRSGSLLLRTVLMICTSIVVIAVMFAVWQTVNTGQLAVTLFLLAFLACWILLFLYCLQEVPRVWLSEEGVRTRIIFGIRFYPWSEVQQAGILYRMGRGVWYNDLVILGSNGLPRRYKDKTFLIRNLGNTIHLSASREIRDFVIKHYGSLDFDLSDGQCE